MSLDQDYRQAEKGYLKALQGWEAAQKAHQALMDRFAPSAKDRVGGLEGAQPAKMLSSSIFKELQVAAKAEQAARAQYLDARARFIQLAEHWNDSRRR